MSRQTEFSVPIDARALASLFTKRIYRELRDKGRSPTLSRVANESGLGSALRPRTTLKSALEYAFEILEREVVNDYVYRAAITSKVLLGKHSLNTTIMLTEFRVDDSKADIVIVNGTSTAYEIKSDRDRLCRLESQIASYLGAFTRVVVVAAERHLEEIFATVPTTVGIQTLTRNGSLSTLRQPTDDTTHLGASTLFESLRHSEAILVLRSLGLSEPTVPNTELHAALRRLFENIKPGLLQCAATRILRKTRSQSHLDELVRSLPMSLRPLALSCKSKNPDHQNLVKTLSTPLSEVLEWN